MNPFRAYLQTIKDFLDSEMVKAEAVEDAHLEMTVACELAIVDSIIYRYDNPLESYKHHEDGLRSSSNDKGCSCITSTPEGS